MKQFKVTGMSCAACSVRVEKAVKALKGVTDCSVSLLTNSMGVDGPATDEEIIRAVENAGYHAELVPTTTGAAALLNDERTPVLKRRLISSICVLLVLMYVSMGYVMWGWPLPGFLQVRPVSVACIELILTAIVMVINQQFFKSGFKSLLNKAPNMDTLVSMGSGASFLYSLAVLLVMMGEQETGHYDLVETHLHSLYFDSAAMILTLITVGKLLESISKGRTTTAIKDLINLQPQEVCVIRNGVEETISITEAVVGDVFTVKSGENIPLDGVVIDGSAAVNEAAITGESLPRDIVPGDSVRSATNICTGYIRCRATKVGEDTTLSQIIRLVSDAASTKAPISRVADKVSAVFVPVVLGIAFVTAIVWLLVGRGIGFSIARAVSVLVISCPCALGLATPVAIMVGSGKGARNGILFKTALTLEQTGRTAVLAMDKTGTITRGEPVVTEIEFINSNSFTEASTEQDAIINSNSFAETSIKQNAIVNSDSLTEGNTEQDILKSNLLTDEGLKQFGRIDDLIRYDKSSLLQIIYNIEKRSEHPLARAICHYIESNYDSSDNVRNDLVVTDYKPIPGRGMSAVIDGTFSVLIGNIKLMTSNSIDGLEDDVTEKIDKLTSCGNTPVLIAIDGIYCGMIAIADVIKDNCNEAINQLHKLGVKVFMLTGDNKKVAEHVGLVAGVDEIVSEVLPEDKEAIVRTIKNLGDDFTVAMAGDGINDAPALTRADIGIAVGNGTDIAIDSADIVIMKNDIMDIPAAIRLSRRVLRNIKENLFWAFVYNIICIPLAAGVYVPIFGWELSPMIAAAAMSLSSFCVVMNALRLNLVDIHDDSRDRATDKSVIAIETIKEQIDTYCENQNIESANNGNSIEIGEDGNFIIAPEILAEKNSVKEKKDTTMKKIMRIDGMMCEHCEARVKKLLENIPDVEEAVVNHNEGTAIVKMTNEVSDEVLIKTITDADYEVKDILFI